MKKLFLLFVLVSVAIVYQLREWTFESGPLTETTTIVISRGSGVQSVAHQLYEHGIIDKPWLFSLVARLKKADKKLKAGEYQFSAKISLVEVLNKISNGDIYYHKLTLPEGLTTAEILVLIQQEESLSGTISQVAEEGTLLPETYSFLLGDSRDSIILRAKEAMLKVKSEAWVNRDVHVPVKTPEELIVLASIIEKETALVSERGLVSSVFVNRLRKGMRLQTDPTVIYALTLGRQDLERPLTKKDLQVDSPYNTYRYYGLPPSPICNPGKEAIEAAAHPELTDYLYFVASGKGGHNFAVTLQEHNYNVQRYRKGR